MNSNGSQLDRAIRFICAMVYRSQECLPSKTEHGGQLNIGNSVLYKGVEKPDGVETAIEPRSKCRAEGLGKMI